MLPMRSASRCRWGYDFQGIYNIWEKNINLFEGDSRKNIEETIAFNDINSPELEGIIGEKPANRLREELELIDEVYPPFSREEYLEGGLQPVFFGSALNNFGVRELLDCFVEIAPTPRPKESDTRLVRPEEEKLSGFVFKIHANMDPNHRSCIAFIKICSGKFERGEGAISTKQSNNSFTPKVFNALPKKTGANCPARYFSISKSSYTP
jgi:peptide chain release factor 3